MKTSRTEGIFTQKRQSRSGKIFRTAAPGRGAILLHRGTRARRNAGHHFPIHNTQAPVTMMLTRARGIRTFQPSAIN